MSNEFDFILHFFAYHSFREDLRINKDIEQNNYDQKFTSQENTMIRAFGPTGMIGISMLSFIITIALLIYIISLFRRMVLAIEDIARNVKHQ